MKTKKIVGIIVLVLLYISFFWVLPICMTAGDWWKVSLFMHGAFAAALAIAFFLHWAFD